jgi:hypothetical protein
MTIDDDLKQLTINRLESELNLANDNLRLMTKVRDRMRTVRRRQHEVPI